MNPDERKLLEENHKMLKKLIRAEHWGQFWGFVRILVFVVPLVLGYIYLQPYLGTLSKSLEQAQSVLNQLK